MELPGFAELYQQVHYLILTFRDTRLKSDPRVTDNFVHAFRGGAGHQGPLPTHKVTTANVTSMMLHWRTIAEIDSDFVHLTETRVSPSEQSILQQALLTFADGA